MIDRDTGNLLRAIIRPRTDRRGENISKLAEKIGCWEGAIDAALQHGVLSQLYLELKQISSAIPPPVLECARKEFERNAFHCLANTAELLAVLRAFESAGIKAVPFKGVVLGASAYGNMTSRVAGDLDVLVYYNDLLDATRILKDRGYELKTKVSEDGLPAVENYFEYHFERADDGMVLELRWRFELTQPRYRHDLGMDWAWPRRTTIKLAGSDIPSLDPVSCLLMLCMHGSKHVWSRLIWICDVAKLLEREPGLNWNLARQEARRVGLNRCLALGVLLAQKMAGAQVPASILSHFEADRSARRLADFLSDRLVEEPGTLPHGRIPYTVRLLAFPERAAIVLSPTFLRPTELDRAVVKLPKSLSPLYYLIRPFRILLDRSSR